MRRREFVQLAAGAAMVWPLAARAQEKAMPVIGYLASGSPGPSAPNVAAFRQGLSETGWVIRAEWHQGWRGSALAPSGNPVTQR